MVLRDLFFVQFDATDIHPRPTAWLDTPAFIAKALQRVREWRRRDRIPLSGMSQRWLREFNQAYVKREPPY